MGFSVKQKGDYNKLRKYLNKQKTVKLSNLDKYGEAGVKALSFNTPYDSGETANSWYYKINSQNGRITIDFCNSNINNSCSIAIILQYGHGTKNGGWVEGRDYINPALTPIFNNIAEAAWKEVTKI